MDTCVHSSIAGRGFAAGGLCTCCRTRRVRVEGSVSGSGSRDGIALGNGGRGGGCLPM